MRRFFTTLLFACLAFTALPVFAADKPLEPGVDYVEMPNGKPWQPLAGKVEVVEVFSYSCPHCAHFQPAFSAWKARVPKNVRVTYLPAAFNPDDPNGLAYFAGLRKGIIARAHNGLFVSIHEKGDFPLNASVDEYAAYLSAYGVNRDVLAALMRSKEVRADMARARAFQVAAEVGGTPTLVLNGRYRVLGQSVDDQFRIVNQLIQKLSVTKPR